MALVDDDSVAGDSPADRHDPDHHEDLHLRAEGSLGEVPEGVGSDLYPSHLERLRHEEAFGEAVLSFPDADGTEQEIPLDEVAGTEHDHDSNRTKILLRNGAIVVVTGAVIAGAVAAIRYRRRHKQ